MSLTLFNTPGSYFSANGDLIFTIKEDVKPYDSTTYPDYKYVCDVYIDSSLIVRLRSFPHPTSKIGVFDISNIVRDYVDANFNPSLLNMRSQQQGEEEFFVNVTCNFGEEYSFVTYTNLLIDSQRTYFNHYNTRLNSVSPSTILTSYLDKALTARSYATPVDRGARFCFIPFLPTDTSDVTLVVKSYNTLGLIGTLSQPYTPSGANVQQVFNVAPYAINLLSPLFISDYIDYYTVEFTTTNIIDDSLYRFDLKCEAKYEVFTLHFLNRFGGFESREFNKVSRKTIDIEKSNFGLPGYLFDVSGFVKYGNSNNVIYDTQKTYAVEWKEKMVLNTDILTDAEYRWLADIVLSPMVYIEMESYFIPVSLTANNYDFKKSINDKLTNLTINIEFGDRFNTQFR